MGKIVDVTQTVKLENISMDVSIQCRAEIDIGIVNEYAEAMSEGNKFPAVELFSDDDDQSKYYVGDGWHRILAAKQVDAEDILADVWPGGKIEALKFALGANAEHGHRRTNADKRRCVELALKEFPEESSRSIAKICAVSDMLVGDVRGQVQDSCTLRKGSDGKRYPAKSGNKRRRALPKWKADLKAELKAGKAQRHRKLGPPCNGMQFARMAIMDLEQIRLDDAEREQAFDCVKNWIKEHEFEMNNLAGSETRSN
jgi:hypothetical protein